MRYALLEKEAKRGIGPKLDPDGTKGGLDLGPLMELEARLGLSYLQELEGSRGLNYLL